MLKDEYFNKRNCDRCHAELQVRILSWFKDEIICEKCSDEEKLIKQRLNEKEGKGADLKYERCGYLPKAD